MFVTPIFRERIGLFLMLKPLMRFAIASQKDLNAPAPNQPQPPAWEPTSNTSESGARPGESDLDESDR